MITTAPKIDICGQMCTPSRKLCVLLSHLPFSCNVLTVIIHLCDTEELIEYYIFKKSHQFYTLSVWFISIISVTCFFLNLFFTYHRNCYSHKHYFLTNVIFFHITGTVCHGGAETLRSFFLENSMFLWYLFNAYYQWVRQHQSNWRKS